MAFAGFRSGLQDEFNGWRLPDRVVKEFNLRLVHDLAPKSPIELPHDSEGMCMTIVIEDYENPGTHYQFILRIRRNDMDFWVANIHAFAYDRNGDVIWSSRSDGP